MKEYSIVSALDEGIRKGFTTADKAKEYLSSYGFTSGESFTGCYPVTVSDDGVYCHDWNCKYIYHYGDYIHAVEQSRRCLAMASGYDTY